MMLFFVDQIKLIFFLIYDMMIWIHFSKMEHRNPNNHRRSSMTDLIIRTRRSPDVILHVH